MQPVDGEITDDIPAPMFRSGRNDAIAGTMLEMKVGQSAWWRKPETVKSLDTWKLMLGSLSSRLRKNCPANRWTVRVEGDGVRIWRVE